MITILSRLFIKEDQLEKGEIRRKYGMLSSIVGIVLNCFLFFFKYLAGVLSGSIAIMADAFNNLSDAGSSIITLIGFQAAGKKPDLEHPFGHGRIEYISGLAVAVLILLMGVELAKSAVDKMIHPQPVETGAVAIGILVVSILVKFYMAFYNQKIGKRLDSSAMKATAIDSISDTFSTFLVLIGMMIVTIADVNIDGICGLLVAGFVLWAGLGAMKETMKPLLGQAPDKELVSRIEELVMAHEEIVGIHDLVVHDYGPGRIMVSLHAEVVGDGNIYELHDAIDCAENELNSEIGCEAVIHMDPIAVNDSRVNALKTQVKTIVGEMNEQFSIHDFRMVAGPTHTNLIFDLLIPAGYKAEDEDLKKELQQRISQWNSSYFIVIKVDHSYL
ncbi:MAG: cation diffusion facilitator family transporter [Lachnospiraceae bacterium]